MKEKPEAAMMTSSRLKRVVDAVANSPAELIMCLFSIAYYMPTTYISNVLLQKQCLRHGYPRAYCMNDKVNETLEMLIQGEVSDLLFYHNFLRQFPAVILSLFMGQWCDMYGRKYVLIVANAGCALSSILYYANTLFMDWPPLYMVLSALPAGLSGEYAGFMMGLYGFIRDVHPLKALSVRVSTADGAEAFAMQVGPLMGEELYKRFAYEGVFLTCAAVFTVAVVCTAIFVQDRMFCNRNDTCVVVSDFFNFRGFFSCVSTVFKNRDGHFRAYIICVMVSAFLTTMTYAGLTEIQYLYTRLTIQWNLSMFDQYSGLIGGANTIGSMILLPLLVNVLHWTDSTLGLVGLVANVIYYYTLIFASNSITYYWTVCLQVLGILCYVTFRSIITKCISFTEMGKVMAVYAVIQAASTNLGQVVATAIYAHTYRFFPATYLIFAGAVGLICIAIYGWIYVDLNAKGVVLEDD